MHGVDEVVVVAHDPDRARAECDALRAGERGDVDEDVGLVLLGADERVGEDETTLGVGVEHLDGLAAVRDVDVTGLLGRAARHVLGEAQVGRDVDGDAQTSRGEDRSERRGRAAHVALHLVHSGGRLDRDAAGVEGDALADQGQVRGCALGPVGQAHEARSVGRAAADGEDAAVAAVGESLLVEHLDVDREAGSSLDGMLGEVSRHEVGRGGVDQIAGAVDGCCQRAAATQSGQRCGVLGVGDLDRQTTHGSLLRRLAVGTVGQECVGTECGALDDGVEVGRCLHREREHGTTDSGQRARRVTGRPAQRLVAPRPRADADGEDDGRGRDPCAGDAHEVAGLAGRTERGQRLLELAAGSGLETGRGPDQHGALLAATGRGRGHDEDVGGLSGQITRGEGQRGHEVSRCVGR